MTSIKSRFRVDTSKLERLVKKVETNKTAALKRVGDEIVNDVKASMLLHSSPSPRGEPPAVVTGTLRASVRREDRPRDDQGRFASGSIAVIAGNKKAYYAGYLETGHLDRPYLAPAVERAQKRMAQKFRGVVSTR